MVLSHRWNRFSENNTFSSQYVVTSLNKFLLCKGGKGLTPKRPPINRKDTTPPPAPEKKVSIRRKKGPHMEKKVPHNKKENTGQPHGKIFI